MIGIVALSHACNRAINRAPYRLLAERGWAIDVVVLAATLGGLIDDAAMRADYGRRACERAHELFSLPAQADRMEELFRCWTEPSARASLHTSPAGPCLNAS